MAFIMTDLGALRMALEDARLALEDRDAELRDTHAELRSARRELAEYKAAVDSLLWVIDYEFMPATKGGYVINAQMIADARALRRGES